MGKDGETVEKVALQLYSIRELTEKDFLGSLEKVAQIGYDGVEFAGYFNTSAKQLKRVLDDVGLKAAGTHTGVDIILNNTAAVIEYNLEIGNKYIICPSLPEHMTNSAEAFKRTADLFNQVGLKCNENGIQFGYHNHDYEFKVFDGDYGLNILFKNTEPDLVHFELDTYWVEYSGLKSTDIIEKFKERCSILHIKDMKSREQRLNTEIGKGHIDWKPIVQAGKKYHVDWFTVEQEEFDIPVLQSIQESLQYLRSIL